MKVEVDVLGSPSLIVRTVGLCGRKATLDKPVHRSSQLRSCVKGKQMDFLGSPSLIVRTVSVESHASAVSARERRNSAI